MLKSKKKFLSSGRLSMNFNEIFGKNVIYNDLKSHKKAGFYPLTESYIFLKTIGSIKLTSKASTPQPFGG